MKKINLIKYMAINVFSIDNLFKKQGMLDFFQWYLKVDL